MWELISANKKKSLFLFILMGICLVLLGYFIGNYFSPQNGGIIGLLIAIFIWFFMSLISFFSGDSIILALSKAKEVTPEIHQQLFNVVEEMKIAANLPAMPKVYIIPDFAPNAFATGRKPENSAIVVTAGLLSLLDRDELQGVIAHETSHIMNRDILFMTFAGVMLGSIIILSQLFLRSMWFSGGRGGRYRSKSSSQGGGQLQLILIVVAIVLAILAPLLAQLLYFAISRKREYLADASSVRLTRYPEGLASALEKISNTNLDLKSANKATAPLYIVNPLKRKGKRLSNITSTHPPITERIKILRSISQGANYINYQNAYSYVKGKVSRIIPHSEMHATNDINLRKPSTEIQKPKERKQQIRDLGDLMRKVNKYLFLTCVCGLKIKIPPDFKKSVITCPRCGHENNIPMAELAAVSEVIDASLSEKDKKQHL